MRAAVPENAWREPGHHCHDAVYLDISRNEVGWRGIFTTIDNMFGKTKKTTILLEPDTEVFKIIKKMIPWDITLLQLSKGPKCRLGMKPDLNWNHRGNVTLNTGNEINFETEFRNDIVQSMQRFTDKIKYGIFFYGFAPDEEQHAAENLEQPRERAEYADAEEPYKGGTVDAVN